MFCADPEFCCSLTGLCSNSDCLSIDDLMLLIFRMLSNRY